MTDEEQYQVVRYGPESEFRKVAADLRFFGFYLANRYRGRYNYPDIVGTMQVTLMEALWDIRRGHIDHYTAPIIMLPYLRVRISNTLKRFITTDRILPVSVEAYQNGKRKFKVFSLTQKKSQFRSEEPYGFAEFFDQELECKFHDLAHAIDWPQLLESLSPIERNIIESKAGGYCDREIGETFSPPISRQRVHQIRTRACAKLISQIPLQTGMSLA